jgi:tRNA(His) 5'-end guanylyltransferase
MPGQRNDLEQRMRALEYFHGLRLLPHTWPVVRVDGRAFSRLTEQRFAKPFDAGFHGHMVAAARALLEELQGVYAYTESDEISVLLPREFDLFDRELEKVVSVAAGVASAAFTAAAGVPGHFDGRVWLGADRALVRAYFLWRQDDAARCALNGWCYWTLRQAGQSAIQATRALERQGADAKHELLLARGVNFAALPSWQRRGVGLRWETYDKPAVNPQTGQPVLARRRRIALVDPLPTKEAYEALLEELCAAADSPRGLPVAEASASE